MGFLGKLKNSGMAHPNSKRRKTYSTQCPRLLQLRDLCSRDLQGRWEWWCIRNLRIWQTYKIGIPDFVLFCPREPQIWSDQIYTLQVFPNTDGWYMSRVICRNNRPSDGHHLQRLAACECYLQSLQEATVSPVQSQAERMILRWKRWRSRFEIARCQHFIARNS